MAYVGVAKALYDYTAQDPEDEISFAENQILYIIEKGDDEWWKAKLKDEQSGTDGPVGLIPKTYVEEIPPVGQTRALYAYESTSPEELSMDEDAILHVYADEDEWILVQIDGDNKLGFVPRNYCEELDAEGAGQAPSAAEIEAQRAADEEERQRVIAARQRELKTKDKVETWPVSQLDGKKKKKGTLGVGSGTIFFASDTDKAPVKQHPITDLQALEQPSSKVLSLTIAGMGQPLQFNTGSSKTSKAIIEKLELSKAAAGEALEVANEAPAGPSDEEEEEEEEAVTPPPAEPQPTKSVRWAEDAPTQILPPPQRSMPPAAPPAASREESCVVLYDFDAGGDDELTVVEGEQLTVVEKENDEWWLVRNSRGQEGVVPAQYVELAAGGSPVSNGHDEEAERRRAEEEAAAAAASAEAARKAEQERKAEQRRAIERAAHEREAQEAADRELAEQIELEERAKRERRASRHDEEQRRRAQRREEARSREPPEVSKRPSAQDVNKAARSLPSGRGKNAPEPPKEDRPKPNPNRTRVWSDRTGQFKVEAEFLGMSGNKLRLHKMNGVIIEVPLEKMAPEDVNLVRKQMQRRRQQSMDDDDVPLGKQPRKPSQQLSNESHHRSERHSREARESREPREGREQRSQQPRKPAFDWFAFFLDAGCQMDDCTRYAANFERDRIDETILADLDPATMRQLGLREGDVIRVNKVIKGRYGKKTPEQEAQLTADEEYARKLQEHENSGGKGPAPVPPPGLFTNAEGKLANNTRRGRPERKASTAPATVEAAALAAASDQLSKVSLTPLEPERKPTPPVTVSPPPEEKKEAKPAEPAPGKNLMSGFDDDAWTIKPAAKPTSPAPPPAQPTPPPATTSPQSANGGTDALLAQIQALRPASTGAPAPNAELAQAAQQGTQTRATSMPPQSSMPPPSSYGLGAANTGAPMSHLQQQQQQQQVPQIQQPTMDVNAPRGPLAPVKQNEGLLNPLQPSMTGMFVPTRAGSFSGGVAPQVTGYQQPMATGMQGYQPGFQQQAMQPAYTGFGGYPQQQQQNTAFNAIANMPPPPQVPQPTGAGGGDKFAPSNIFSAMKRTDFTKDEEQNPQPSGKYDALRPLTTGYNGAPGMYPQQTGMYPQATGMPGMQMQGTGMPMGMGGMGGGMMPQQMTGYNPQMGQMGWGQQQNPFGGGY